MERLHTSVLFTHEKIFLIEYAFLYSSPALIVAKIVAFFLGSFLIIAALNQAPELFHPAFIIQFLLFVSSIFFIRYLQEQVHLRDSYGGLHPKDTVASIDRKTRVMTLECGGRITQEPLPFTEDMLKCIHRVKNGKSWQQLMLEFGWQRLYLGYFSSKNEAENMRVKILNLLA